jgi:uncharacterized protein YkwD
MFRRNVSGFLLGGLAFGSLLLAPATTAPIAHSSAPARAALSVTAPHLRQVSSDVLSSSQYEFHIFYWVNRMRVDHGLPKLAYGSCIKTYAVRQAGNMHASDTLYHQSMMRILYACDGYRDAENIAYGAVTPHHMVSMWMNSAGHRANILDPRLHWLASGAVRSSSGRWWASQVFMAH